MLQEIDFGFGAVNQPKARQLIFLVDDEVAIVELFTLILKREGYDVDSTTNSIEALEMVRANPAKYDVLVSDYSMPGLTGDKLVEEMHKVGFAGKTVIFSGHVPNDRELWRQTIGVDAVAEKANPASLLKALARVAGRP